MASTRDMRVFGTRTWRNTCPACGHNVGFAENDGMKSCGHCGWSKAADKTPRWWNYVTQEWVLGHPYDPGVGEVAGIWS